MPSEYLLILWMVLLVLSRLENRQGRDIFGFWMSALIALSRILWNIYVQTKSLEITLLTFLCILLIALILYVTIKEMQLR